MAVDNSQSPETLAALLAEAATRPFAPVFGLPGFLKRYIIRSSEVTLPSGLEPDEAAKLASAVAAALHEVSFPITNATFRPENIRVSAIPSGWKVSLELETGAALSLKGGQAAFGGLLYRLAEGQDFALNFSGQKAQLTQLRQHNPYLANVLEEAVNGRFSSAEALAGGFGWSLYRQTHLNNAVAPAIETQNLQRTGQAQPVAQLPGETTAPMAAANRAWGGPVAMVSLLVAVVLLAGMVLFSISDLDNTYQQRSQVLPTRTALPTIAPTPTPAQALQINRQTDGANLTRYNPALDPTTGERYVDPVKLTAGQVAAITNFNVVKIESARWSPDGQKVDLALTNGGWETWDLAARQRLARKEIPNNEHYLSVSWSPDGQNFVAVGMDGQMQLGKNGRVLRTVAYQTTEIDAGGNPEYPAEYSWSPDGNFVLMTVTNNHLQFWNFQNTPAPVEPVSTEFTRYLSMRGSRLKGQFAWSADSRYLARITAGKSNPLIEIYNPRNLAQLYEIAVTDVNSESVSGQSSNPYSDETLTLAWSPDGRYMAVSRPYNSDLAGDAYSINPEGSLVSILEFPDMSNWITPALGRQFSPRPQSPNNITPAARGNPSTIAVNPGGIPLKPLHFETMVLTRLSNLYYTSGHLAWSGNNRLLVLGSSPNTFDNTQTLKGLTLNLGAGDSSWHWQIDTTFDLPFEAPQLTAWLPDNRHFLFNTYSSLLGQVQVPEQQGQPLTTEIYQKSAGQADLEYLPSPDGRFFLLTEIRNNRPTLTLREITSGTIKTQLDLPVGQFIYAGKAKWSPDGRYLAMSFVVEASNNGGTPNSAQILRAWRIEPDKAPQLIGDFLAPAFFGSSFDSNGNLEWDSNENDPAVLFEFEGFNIGRWYLNKPLPSLASQKIEIEKNAGNILTSESKWTYFEVKGRVLGKISNGVNGKYAWLPDHKHMVYCETNCYIQDLLAPGASYTAEQARGTRFDPQPLSGTARSSRQLGSPLVSPDGRIVVITLPGGLLNLYDTATGKLFNSFTAHQGSISTLNFSPDGRYLVTGGTDRAVKVWDTTSWRNLALLRVVTTSSNISRLEWLPDNKTLTVGANYRGSLLYWRALA